MTVPADKPRRRKWPWRVLWGMLALTISLTGLWCWTYWSAKSERDGLLAQIRARGEPLTTNKNVERLLSEPNENSGAEWLIKAAALYEQLDAKFEQTDPVRQIDFDFKKENPTPGIHAIVERRIRGGDEFMRLLEEAAKRPPGVPAPADQKKLPLSLRWEVGSFTEIENFLYWTSFDALARDDADRAYKALWLRLSLFEQASRIPFLTKTLNRLSRVHVADEHLRLCLAYASPREPRFRQIDGQLSRSLDCLGVKRALISERAEYLATIDDPAELQKSFEAWREWWPARGGWTPEMESAWIRILGSPLGRPLILKEQCAYIHLIDRLSGIIDRPDVNWWEGVKAIDAFVASSPLAKEAMDRLVHQGTSGVRLVGSIAPNSRRRLILARLALRLRRHYDTHGEFPEALEAVCDKTMPTINLEWFQNLPLVYKPRKDGFLLDVSDKLDPGPGFNLRTNKSDRHTFLAWDVTLKTLKRQGAAK